MMRPEQGAMAIEQTSPVKELPWSVAERAVPDAAAPSAPAKPVRKLPGSRPRMRVGVAGDIRAIEGAEGTPVPG